MRCLLTILTVAASWAMPSETNAELVGLWEFEDSGNLAKATIGSDLVQVGSALAVAGAGNGDMGAAQLSNGDYFIVTNPIGANGGGANTNEYTLVMDFNAPGRAWNSLVDISTPFNIDGDVFTNPSGRLGIDGDYFGIAADGSWHRIALVFDMASSTSMTTYIDGVLNHAHTDLELTHNGGFLTNAQIDGRWSLRDTFKAFSDSGGGEEETLAVSNFALFDMPLNVSEVSELGGPGRVLQSRSPRQGDFNEDGSLDIVDLDTLTAAIQSASFEANFDLDRSGVVDLADRQHWVTDIKQTWVGDTNLDGVFDTSDMIIAFSSGQYEDTIADNSTWSTGDWNGDGEFNSSDMIEAFGAGGYEAGPRAAVSAVPEPSSTLLTLLGLFLSAPFALKIKRQVR